MAVASWSALANMIVTSSQTAHCLPRHPKPHLANGVPELTYANLIGPLANDERTIWAGLVVDNLVDDVAVLAEPDGHELSDDQRNGGVDPIVR
jgi:hypothetical protein